MKSMLLKCKRIFIAVFAAVVVLSAFNMASACPHFDINNDFYMVEYDYRGRPHHYIYFYDLHERELYVDPEKIVDPSYNPDMPALDLNAIKDFVYYEKYKMYLYESGDPAVNRFSHIKEFKVLDASTKIVPISQHYYTLNVPVEKIYKEAQEKKKPIEHTVLYNLVVADLNERYNQEELGKSKNAVASTKFEDIGYKFLWIKPYTDYASGMEGVDEKLLEEYPEAITITFKLEGVSVHDGSALMALAIDDESYAVTELGGTYNKADNTFTFKAAKRGIYTLVAKEAPVSSSPDTSSQPSSSSSQDLSSEEVSSEDASEVESEIGTGSESEAQSEVSSEESSEASGAESSQVSSKVEDEKGGMGSAVVAAVVVALVIAAAGGVVLYFVKFKK